MLQKNQIPIILFVIYCNNIVVISSETNKGNLSYEVPKELPQAPHCGRTRFDDDDDDGLSDRIVGGFGSADGAWPWMALLGTNFETYDSIQWICGGSLISIRWILTAAHCYYDANEALNWTRLGANNVDDESATDMKVVTILHPDFIVNGFNYDIALAKLDEEIKLTERIRPICLPYQRRFRHTEFENEYPFVAGWGTTNFSDFHSSDDLLELQLKIVDPKQCAEAYNKLKVTINNKHICAGYTEEEADTCQGDSGGPLMLYDVTTEAFFQIGIVSFGYKCAIEDYPGIYSKVADDDYLEWISANVNEG